MTAFLKQLIHTSTIVGLCLIVMSCGGESTSESAAQGSSSTADTASDLTPAEMAINASSLNRITFAPVTKIGGQNFDSALTYNAALLNATGNFKYPKAGDLFKGNVTVSINAEDTDGIKRVLLGFSGTSDVLVICEEDCGTAVSTMVNGISPHLFEWQSGENNLELWVEDVADNLQQVDIVNINWQSKVITGVAASLDEATETLNVVWDVNDDVLRYNLYVTNESGLTGQNYIELEGGDAKLSLTTNSASLSDKPIGNSYFILVTGIDGTGESAYSNTLLLAGDVITVAPIAVNDAFTVVEDNTLNANFITNDTVFDEGVIFANTAPVSGPSNGQVNINSDGSFSYVPNSNFTGTDLFTYAIFNENNQTSEASVTITVTPVNDAPTALDDNITMTNLPFSSSENGVLANDNDVDGDTFTAAIDPLNLPTFGAVQLFSNGTFEYTPAENFVNYDRFGYIITDPSGATSQAIVVVTTPDFNGYPPITVNDQFQLNEDTLLVVNSENAITNNDLDEDTAMGDIILTLVQTTQNGTLLLASDGTFSYQPNPNFFGLDTFQYQLTDEKDNTTTATVELTVLAQNDIPTALNDSYKLTNDATANIHRSFGVLANDTDIDGDNINVDLSSVTQPSFGQVDMATNGSFSYTANSDFIGTDSFSYRISDGNLLSSIATVSVSVVDVIATTEDITPIELILADISDQLPSNATLNTATALNGTATFNNGVVQYTPEIGFDGIDNLLLVFESEDGEFEINLSIRVNLSNQPPVIVSSDQVSVSENAAANTLITTVLIEDEDVANSTFSLTDDTNTFAIDQNSGQITLASPINFEQTSSYQVAVVAEDPLGVTTSQTITIAIIDVPETPMITSSATLSLDEHLGTGTIVYTPTVYDDDNDTEFTFTLTNAGEAFTIDASTGAVSVNDQAALDFETSPTFNTSISVTDGSSLSSDFSLTITLLDVNEAPVISSHTLLMDTLVESFSSTQTTSFITMNAVELDAMDSLSWTLTGSSNFLIDSQTGEISIIAGATFDFETTPMYLLNVTATDQAGLTASYDIQVNVTDENEQPIITSASLVSINENIDTGTLVYTPVVSDGDNETEFTFVLTNGGDAFSIDPNTGAITVQNQSSLDFETTPSFDTVITVSDASGLSTDFDLAIALLNVNEAPEINNHTMLIDPLEESFSPEEATSFITFDSLDVDSPETLTWTLIGASNFTIDEQTGEINIIAGAVFDFETTPLYTLNVTVTDLEGLNDSYEFDVTIANVNEAPVPVDDVANVINYDSVEIFALENDTDPELDALSIVTASAESGSIEIVEGAHIVYTPNANITSDIISYTVSDTLGLETTAQVLVTVSPLPLAGQHDINGDELGDLDITYDSDNNAWSFAVADHVDGAFEIIDNKQYPFELESDNTSTYTTLSDQAEHNFGIVIAETLYYLTVPLLDATASLQIDFDGTDLSALLTEADLVGEFIVSKPTYSGKNAFQRIAVNPLEVTGALMSFNEASGVKTGSYTYDSGQEEFTWALSGSELTITLNTPQTDEESITVDELLELGAIDQTTYDTYVGNYGSGDIDVNVSVEIASLTLTIVKNRALYLETIESYVATYTLPSELGGNSVVVNEDDKSYRLYPRANIGSYTFAALSGNYVLPLFDLSKSDYEQSAISAFFDINGTGSLVDHELTFTWTINEQSQLEVNIENGDTYTFTKTTFDDSAFEVLISGSASDQPLAAIGYVVKEQDLSSFDLTNLLTNNVLLDARSNSQIDSFDANGKLQTKYLNAHIIGSTTAQNAPTGMVEATRILSFTDGSDVTNWAAQIGNDALHLVQFIDTDQGLQYCDPKSDSGCYEALIDSLNIKAYDPETNRLWIVESIQVLDIDSVYQSEPVPTYETLVEFLTYYTISPTANPVDDALTINEEELATNIDVLSNDLDSQNATTEMQVVGANAIAGMISLDQSGQLDYATSPNFNGEDTIQYIVLDSLNNLGTAKVVLTVNPVNDAPIAYADIITLNEGDSIALDPRENDYDIDADALTIVSFGTPTNGSLTQNGDGTLQYTHNGSETVTDSTTYVVTDGTVNVSSTIDFVITLTNDVPIAVDDTANVNESSSITISVKDNDSDAETATNDLIVTINQQPTSGSVTVNGDGTITYAHNGDETIADSFIYNLSDGELSANATVNITIVPVNDAPIAVDDSVSVENYGTQVFDVLVNDTDADGDALTVFSAVAASGNVVIEADNTLTYTPIDNATSDTISYVVSDGLLQSAAATVSISVTPQPLTGNLDINANGSDDIVVVEVSESNEWQIAVTNVDLLFEIKNNRYYAIEAEADGSFDLSLPFNSSDIQFGAVIGDELHIVDMYDLTTSAKIAADRVGSNLPNNIDLLPTSFDLIRALPITKNGFVQQAIGVHPSYSTGDIYHFDRTGQIGTVADIAGEQSFSWTQSDDVITINMVNPTEHTEYFEASTLLDLNLISQTEYDDFIATTEDQYQTFSVVISMTSQVIQVTDNVELYLDVNIETRTSYVLGANSDFSGKTYTQYSDPVSYRLYNKATVGTYGTADLSSETWYFPRFEELNDVFNRRHYASDFNSDGTTGVITDLAASFDWQIDSDGIITVQLDFSPDFENYTLTPLSENSGHRIVLVEATHTIDGNKYATLSYFAKDNTYSSTDIVDFVNDKKLMSSFVTMRPSSFNESGQLLADNIFSFRLQSTEATAAPSGENNAVRDYAFTNGNAISLNQTDWTWSESSGEISLKAYYDEYNGSYILCDPESDQYCTKLRERTWKVINIDAENRNFWVIESEEYIELWPSENEGTATYYQNIGPRLNHYQINDPLYLISDTATATEEVALNGIDVLSNDLDSKGATGNLRVIGVSAYYGEVTTDGVTIDYTPNVDNNYPDTITYIVADEYNQYDNSTLTINFTPVNDAPTIDSNPDTTATEAIAWDYQITVSDVDDFDLNTDFTFTVLQGPTGMAVDTSGYVTWTPGDGVTTSGEVVIEVADGGEDGVLPVTQTFTISVLANPLLDNISFTDSAIQACLYSEYDGSTTRLLNVTNVNCASATALDDLTQFDNLRYLNVTNLSDWSELANLDLFEFSAFGAIDIPDWTLLSGHTNLTGLTLYSVNLADWSFLTDFDLNYLNLDFSNLADLSDITHMTNLSTLLLTSNDVSDWSGLTNFSLSHFSAAETSFSDLSLLASMNQMAILKLYQTSVSDWSSLVNFNLYLLEVQNTSFADMSLLSSMSNLYSLNISDTPTADFTDLTNLQLSFFHAENTLFDDTAMSNLSNSQTSLVDLNISGTSVTDFSPLLSFENLQSLHIDITGTSPAANAILLSLYNSDIDIHSAEDSDANDIMDFLEDPDSDGLINSIDTDDDNDGTLDGSDAYPLDPTLQSAVDLGTAVDYTDYEVTSAFTGGQAYWFEQSAEFTNGSTAIRSGVIAPNEHTDVTTTVDAGEDGALFTFDWKVSSEATYDILELYVDASFVTSISGEQDWAEYQVVLSEGTHSVTWRYSKNGGTATAGDDAAWLDNINITLYDTNDAPVINNSSIFNGATSIAENITAIATVTATDEEAGVISYTLSGNDADKFSINTSTGVLTFTSAPNFDSPTDANSDNVYEVNIIATDDDASPLSDTELLLVTVTDVLESPLISSANSVSVIENTVNVMTVTATDSDTADVITYSITGNGIDDYSFNIDSATGVLTFSSAPDFDSPYDYDYDNIYEVEVQATDDSASLLSDTMLIFVTVVNLNEAPVISNVTTTGTADENQTAVVDVDAADEDTSDSITYSLSGTDAALLNIDSATGIVTFNAQPDFESAIDSGADGTYEFTVTATDNGAGNLFDSISFVYTVSNVNEAPVISTATSGNADENQLVAFDVDATDVDSGDTLTYTISGTDAGVLNIDSSTGVVSFNDSPDFETPVDFEEDGYFDFVVTVTDAGGLQDTVTMVVTLSNVNEAPMITTGDTVAINENQVTVIDVDADDVDTADTLSFSLSGTDAALFTIDSVTGVVSFISAADYETPLDTGNDGAYEFTVTATDDGTGNLTDSVDFIATVDNLNEAAVFSTADNVIVNENVYSIMTVTAADPESDTVTYAKAAESSDGEFFTINSSSGELTFSSLPDFESLEDSDLDNVFIVAIEATEAGSGLVTTQSIAVTLNNVDENIELALDTSFNGTGINNFNTFADSYSEYLVDAVQDASGSRYLALKSSDGNTIIVAKLNSSGYYDVSFGVNGIKFIDPNDLQDYNVDNFDDSPTGLSVTDIQVDASGKVYLAGSQDISMSTAAMVIRLNADGQLDTSFSNDGKYELRKTYPTAEVVDVLVHSAGTEVYLLAATPNNFIGQASNNNAFVIEAILTSDGSFSDDITEQTNEYTPVALGENSSGNIIAIANNLDTTSIDVIEYDTSITELASQNIDIQSEVLYCTLYPTNDEAYTLMQPDSSTLLIGGSSNCLQLGGSLGSSSNEEDALIVRMSADTLAYDTSFDSNGIAMLDVDGSGDDDPVVSISQDSAGNIAFVTKTSFGGGDAFGLTLNQYEPTGVLSTLSSVLNALDLTQSSGSESGVKAVVLQDIADGTDKLTIISSREIAGETAEIETYLVEYIPEADSDLSLKIDETSFVYDFSPVNTQNIAGVLLASSDRIYTTSTRSNDGNGASYQGFSLHEHYLSTGLQYQDLIGDRYLGVIHKNGSDGDFYSELSGGLIELSDGSLAIIKAKIDDFNVAYSVSIESTTTAGAVLDIIETSQTSGLVDFGEIVSVHSYYNASTEEIIIYGGVIDSTYESRDSYIVKYDVSDPTAITEIYSSVLDVYESQYSDYLTGAVILDDDDSDGMGDVIAVGTGYYHSESFLDAFVINIQHDGTLLTTFDGDADNNHALEFYIANSSNFETKTMVKLSDDSIVFSANEDSFPVEAYLVKLTHSASGIYTIDTTFDNIMEEGESPDSDDHLVLEPLFNIGSGSSLRYVINDMAVDDLDNIYIVGEVDAYNSYGFVAKISGNTGSYDLQFGGLVHPGFFIPAGRATCDYVLEPTKEIDICDVYTFEKILIDDNNDGDLIIHGLADGLEGKINTTIMKFDLIVDDSPIAYDLYEPGA